MLILFFAFIDSFKVLLVSFIQYLLQVSKTRKEKIINNKKTISKSLKE